MGGLGPRLARPGARGRSRPPSPSRAQRRGQQVAQAVGVADARRRCGRRSACARGVGRRLRGGRRGRAEVEPVRAAADARGAAAPATRGRAAPRAGRRRRPRGEVALGADRDRDRRRGRRGRRRRPGPSRSAIGQEGRRRRARRGRALTGSPRRSVRRAGGGRPRRGRRRCPRPAPRRWRRRWRPATRSGTGRAGSGRTTRPRRGGPASRAMTASRGGRGQADDATSPATIQSSGRACSASSRSDQRGSRGGRTCRRRSTRSAGSVDPASLRHDLGAGVGSLTSGYGGWRSRAVPSIPVP